MVRLYLVRHGKAAASFSEAPNPGLDDTGAAQAEAMVERLAPSTVDPVTLDECGAAAGLDRHVSDRGAARDAGGGRAR